MGGATVGGDTGDGKTEETGGNASTEKQTKNGKTAGKRQNATRAGRRYNKNRVFEAAFDATEEFAHETDVLEVWFAGCHCGSWYLFEIISSRTYPPFSASLLSGYLINLITISPIFRSRRCWWRLRRKLQPAQPRTHPSPMDDPPMLSCQHRDPLPCTATGCDRTRPGEPLSSREDTSSSNLLFSSCHPYRRLGCSQLRPPSNI